MGKSQLERARQNPFLVIEEEVWKCPKCGGKLFIVCDSLPTTMDGNSIYHCTEHDDHTFWTNPRGPRDTLRFNKNATDSDFTYTEEYKLNGEVWEQTFPVDADVVFCKAMVTEGLGRFDVLYDAIVAMYEGRDYKGIDRLMDLSVGTGNRGYVRTVLIAVKPIKHVVTVEKYDRLVEFLRKGNMDTKGRWIPVEEALPDIEEGVDPLSRPMSKKVLVKYELSDGAHYDVDQMYYPNDRAPRWFDHWDTVKAWMEIPE